MSGRDWAYGRALFVFSIAGILGALVLFVRGPQDLPFMTAQGKVGLTLAITALVTCGLLLVVNRNLWFRVAGGIALVVLASVFAGLAVDGAMLAASPADPSPVLMVVAGLVGSNPASLAPDGTSFRLLMLGLGVATYLAAARYNWLGLDRGKPAADPGLSKERPS
jgi:hypothetical protein